VGLENQRHVEAFTEKYGIERVQVPAYHPQANGMIERGHKPIVEALARMTDGGLGNWVRNLSMVLLADRTTVHQPTGKTPFFMVYSREAVLLVELKYPTWRVLDWEKVSSRAELLATRAQQLRFRDEDMEELVLKKRRKRSEGKKAAFDSSKRIRRSEIIEGGRVLTVFELLFQRRGHRSRRIRWDVVGTFAGNRLKKSVSRRSR
jgi:hypothetical protein